MAFNQKNPPWQRNAGHQSISNMQAIVGFPQAQPVYNPNIGLQQQQNISMLPQIGIQQQQAIYSQTVQYPTNRPINAIGFQNQPQSQPAQSSVNQNSSKFNPNNRVFSGTGLVTKLQNDFGFIDDEVFFHKNTCVKGIIPKVGDRVLVDAAYNTNMPFKWNASRVQVVQSSNSNSSSGHVNSSQARSHAPLYNNSSSSQSESRSSNVRNRYSPPPRKSPERHTHRSSNSRSKDDYDEAERRRKRDDRDSDRTAYREKHRERSAERGRERERSPIRKPSPKRRRVRSMPRYMVQVPKHLLTIKQADVLELRRRYNNLYIPSDFFVSDIRWTESFPPDAPFSIRSPCHFHVMHKDVDPPAPVAASGDASLDPPDADYLYSAKVMLMSTPPLSEFYEKCISKSGADGDRYDEERDYMHPTRLISFLVGMRGKNETMAIGGPWSPSLDGADPQSDPTVLIRTALRTCRALTGIDLSSCSQWYRFVELYYRRSESYHKGRLIPPRVETVVIFLPDVRSCQPTRLEWEQLRLSYKASLARVINCSSSGSSNIKVDEGAANPDSSPVVAQATSNSKHADDVSKSSTTSSAVAPSSIAADAATAKVAAAAAAAATAGSAAESVSAPGQTKSSGAVASAETVNVASQQETATVEAAAVTLPKSSPDTVGMSVEQDANDSIVSSGSVSAAAAASIPSTPTAAPAALPSAAPSPAAATPTAVSIMDTNELSESAMGMLQEYKKMKVADLKAELQSRKLPTDGIKAVLLSRLSEAVIREDQELQRLAEEHSPKLKQEKIEEVDTPPKVEVKQEIEQIEQQLKVETDAVMTEVAQEQVESKKVEVKEEKEEKPARESPPKAEPQGEGGDEQVVKSEGKSISGVRKKEEPVKLSEKERQTLERRYQLPEKPHIIVHPSRVAKSGKFDCSVISLSVLLDYRPEDTKEHSFEVALFSELFNEMLTRDFGFNIYRALYALPQIKKESDESKKDGAGDVGSMAPPDANSTSNGEAEGGKTTSGSTNNALSKNNSSSTSSLSEKSDDSKKKSGSHGDEKERDRKRMRRSETKEDERRSRDKDSGKTLVVNSDLLLSFVYFDVTHCGYVAEKDVEDLIYTLGLHLSRSQIRKTVAKATSRDPLHYRKLTDKLLALPAPAAVTSTPAEESAAPSDGDQVVDKSATPVSTVPVTDAPEGSEPNEQAEKDIPESVVARGNTDYKRQLKASLDQLLCGQETAGRASQQPALSTNVNTNNSTGIVEYNGCVVDVGKLLEQVKRTEATREETEKQLVSLQAQHAKLLSSNTRATSKIKDLQTENRSLNRQVADMMRVSRDSVQVQSDYLSVIQYVYDRVRPIAHKFTRDGSSSGGSSKRESSKEKSSRGAGLKSKEKESSKDTTAIKKEDDKGTVKDKSVDEPVKVKNDDDVSEDTDFPSSEMLVPKGEGSDQGQAEQITEGDQPMETDISNTVEKSVNDDE